jgi:hypothetical protein
LAPEVTAFPESAWSPEHLSTVILGEFVRARVNGKGWAGIDLTPDRPDAAGTLAEIGELIELIEYRSAVMAEALAQSGTFMDFFRGVLSFTQSSHPATFRLAWAAMRIGAFQAMHHKHLHKRPRPSHVCPSLMPPIDPPAHAAFPSGHATESKLVALTLGAVMPGAAQEPLNRMAERVARNREVLGVHYPSDSKAGVALATQSHSLLMKCATILRLRKAARREWGLPPN